VPQKIYIAIKPGIVNKTPIIYLGVPAMIPVLLSFLA